MADIGMDARPPLLHANVALYLDFDGTLAKLASHPDGVTVNDSLPALLAALRERLGGAIALVTGRSLAALDAIVGPPNFAAAGLHGLEWRLQSGATTPPQQPDAARTLARALKQRFDGDPRLVVEDKGATVALHFRQAPDRADECISALRELVPPEFEVLLGHKVVEARPGGADKGGAVRTLAAHAPFAGKFPVFVGDDVTDEDGFRAVTTLGGYGVKVGSGESVARYRIGEVDGVHAWLAASLAAFDVGASR